MKCNIRINKDLNVLEITTDDEEFFDTLHEMVCARPTDFEVVDECNFGECMNCPAMIHHRCVESTCREFSGTVYIPVYIPMPMDENKNEIYIDIRDKFLNMSEFYNE